MMSFRRSARRCEVQQAEMRPILDEVSGLLAVQTAVGVHTVDVNDNVRVQDGRVGLPEDEVSSVSPVSTARLTHSAGNLIGSMSRLLGQTEMADASAEVDIADFSLRIRELILLVSSISGDDDVPDVPEVVAEPEELELTEILESSLEGQPRIRRPLGLFTTADLARRAELPHDSGFGPSASTPIDVVDGASEDGDADDEYEFEYCFEHESDWDASSVSEDTIAGLAGFHRLHVADVDGVEQRQWIVDHEDDDYHESGLLLRGDLNILPSWFRER